MSLGIYFGPKEITVVESKGKKVTKHIQIPQLVAPSGELEEKAPAEARMIETVALFKDELRKSKIEAREASVCLSGQDLIIRTFEIPQMPREELAGAISFEAKKYIPFKIEDMISDFQVTYDKVNRTNLVLFMGIKKDTFNRYLSLLSELNLRVSDLEYSAFSVLRSLGLSKLSSEGVVGVLSADLLREDEVNFVVAENGFPLFSRDIILSAGPETERLPREPGLALEKLKTEIRVSLDYYNRKFPTKNIKRIYLICNDDSRLELETFITQIGPFVQFVDVSRNIDGAPPFYLSFIKGFCASLSKTIRTNIKTNLLTVKERVAPAKEKAVALPSAPIFEGVKIDLKVVILGLVICVAAYMFGSYRMQPVKQEISDIVNSRPRVVIVNPDAPYEELTAKESEYKNRLAALNDVISKQLFVTKPLNVIPRAIPEGIWLTRFSFDKKEKDKAELRLEGTAYLENSDEEIQAVNKFVENLKNSTEFTGYFKNISVASIDRTETDKISATDFSVSCKTY